MISSYEELLQYVRKLENALDVKEEGGITTTEVGGHLKVDGDIKQNGEAVALYAHNISLGEIYNENKSGYLFIPIIINSKTNSMTLEEVLNHLTNEGDYYQLPITGAGDFENVKSIESYAIDNGVLTLNFYGNNNPTFIDVNITDLNLMDNITRIL